MHGTADSEDDAGGGEAEGHLREDLRPVEEAAQSFEQPDAVIRWHYEQPDRLNEYEVRAVERNVIDWVLQRARVEDQPTAFSALMEPPAAAAGTGQ